MWGRPYGQGLSMNHPLVATTLTIIFMEKVTRQRCAAVGAGVVKEVCGTVGVVAMTVTMTEAACWLLVGVKVTSAHAPVSSRFLSFSRALCFFRGPGESEQQHFVLSSHAGKNTMERLETQSFCLCRSAVYISKKRKKENNAPVPGAVIYSVCYRVSLFTVSYRGVVTSGSLTCQTQEWSLTCQHCTGSPVVAGMDPPTLFPSPLQDTKLWV